MASTLMPQICWRLLSRLLFSALILVTGCMIQGQEAIRLRANRLPYSSLIRPRTSSNVPYEVVYKDELVVPRRYDNTRFGIRERPPFQLRENSVSPLRVIDPYPLRLEHDALKDSHVHYEVIPPRPNVAGIQIINEGKMIISPELHSKDPIPSVVPLDRGFSHLRNNSGAYPRIVYVPEKLSSDKKFKSDSDDSDDSKKEITISAFQPMMSRPTKLRHRITVRRRLVPSVSRRLPVYRPRATLPLIRSIPRRVEDMAIDDLIERAIAAGARRRYPLNRQRHPLNRRNFHLTALDMQLTDAQYHALMPSMPRFGRRRWKRKAISSVTLRWTDGIVPYEIDPGFDPIERDDLISAMNEWQINTCLQFRPATPQDVNILVFADDQGCSSNVGMIGGRQFLNLQKECRVRKIMLHEIGHALGLVHEHQRDDRDNYLIIHYSNIKPGGIKDFDLFKPGSVDNFHPYNYTSIMHYSKSAFALDPNTITMEAVDPKMTDIMGTSNTLGVSDSETINTMYNCGQRTPDASVVGLQPEVAPMSPVIPTVPSAPTVAPNPASPIV